MANILEERKFSLTELGKNQNKYYNIILYDDDSILANWGRQGVKGGQSKTYYGGRSMLEKKIREKTKKGYIENETADTVAEDLPTRPTSNHTLKSIAAEQIVSSNKIVRNLVEWLADVNAHNIMAATGGKIQFDTSTATFKTTQGVILPHQVKEARSLLDELAKYYDVNGVLTSIYIDEDFKRNLNRYLSLIPRDFGRQRIEPSRMFPSDADLQKETDILDGLEASFAGLAKPDEDTNVVEKPKIFDVDLEILEDSTEFSRIDRFFQSTVKGGHVTRGYKLKVVYTVDIKTMREAFEKYGANLTPVWELWHGTKASNLLSILKQGLVIPPASSGHCSGRMYGNGLYFSDISTKSLNYATNFWGGKGNTSRTFMFLCDVAMGKINKATRGWGSNYPVSGTDSTFARGGSSGVINNEMIVYKLSQANLKYLCEFSER